MTKTVEDRIDVFHGQGRFAQFAAQKIEILFLEFSAILIPP